MQKIGIIGLGHFGLAFLFHLDRTAAQATPSSPAAALEFLAYDRHPDRVAHLTHSHSHPSLYPQLTFSARCHFTADLAQTIQECDYVINALPSTAVTPVFTQLAPLLPDRPNPSSLHPSRSIHLLNLTKALLPSGQTISQFFHQLAHEYHFSTQFTYTTLSGGNIAQDLLTDQVLGSTLASATPAAAQTWASFITSPHLRLDQSTDVLGVEYASAFKNVISLAVGLADGLGFAYGTITHLITRLSYEFTTLAIAHQAQIKSFQAFSQCWGNDMIMSATGQTRNRLFGQTMTANHFTYAQTLDHFRHQKIAVEGTKTLAVLAEHFLSLTPPPVPASSTSSATNPTPYPLITCLIQISQDQLPPTALLDTLSQYVDHS